MFALNLGLVWTALFFVLGLCWCGAILGRWRSDLADLRDCDAMHRIVILGIWLLTIPIGVFVVNVAITMVMGIVNGVRSL